MGKDGLLVLTRLRLYNELRVSPSSLYRHRSAPTLLGELGDAAVGDRQELNLFACQPLLVHHNEALVGEGDEDAERPVGMFDLLTANEERGELVLETLCVDLRSVPQQVVE